MGLWWYIDLCFGVLSSLCIAWVFGFGFMLRVFVCFMVFSLVSLFVGGGWCSYGFESL